VFRGFISTVPITSLDIAGPEDQTVEKWVTINNLYVGSIPEPGTFALGALGLVTLLVWRSRSRR
jgi:MYXO-CTERM domain-containing protein